MADKKLFGKSKFAFIGGIIHGKEPLVTKKLSDTSEWSKTRLSLGIKDEGSSPFLTLEYIFKAEDTTCKLRDKNTKELFEVPLADTTKKEVMNRVNPIITIDLETDFDKKKEYTSLIYKRLNHEMKKDEDKTEDDINKIEEYTKQINDLATNRHEFVHMKDALNFLNEQLPNLKDKKLKVTGNIKSNFYKNKNNLQYIPKMIEIVPDDTENELMATIDIFYDKEAMEDDKESKKIIVNGYIGENVKVDTNWVDKLYPLTVVIDYSKINMEDDSQVALLDILKSTFDTPNKKMMYKNRLQLKVVQGAEEVEFSEDCLTDLQKKWIKAGLKKLDDFKPKNKTFGNRIEELKFISPSMTGDFADGGVEMFNADDLGLYLATNDSDVKKEDVKKENKSEEELKEETKSTKDDMMKALFG